MRSSRLLQLSFLLLGFSLVSCGIKTPPLPPEEFAPEKITDLQVFTKDKEVILKWLIPAKRVDDTKLLDLAGFEVYRKEQTHTEGEEYIPLYRSASADDQADYLLEEEKAEEIINAKDEPESTQEKNWLDKDENDVQEIKKENPIDFKVLSLYKEMGGDEELEGYERIDQILLNGLGEVGLEDDYVIYRDKSLSQYPQGHKLNKGYSYLVISFDKSGLSSRPSNIVQISLLPMPKPPTNLFGIREEGRVLLFWTAPEDYVNGSSLAGLEGFNLYRKGVRDSEYPFYPLNEEITKENYYVDTEVSTSETYVYIVRAVMTKYPTLQESEVSNEAVITLRDTYPPKAPQGLVAVTQGKTIVLNWNPSSERDLLGYYVYRKSSPEANYQRITTVPLSKTTFKDEDIQPSQVYFYGITAVDNASSPNESLFSNEIQVIPLKKE